MTALTLQAPSHAKVLIVGPLYDCRAQFYNAKSIINNYDIVIFNGNITYPNDNLVNIKSRIDELENILSDKVIYNLANYDLELLNKISYNNPIHNWISSKSNIVIINFDNKSFIITGGGISPNITKNDLQNNIETSFISMIDGKPWHQFYGGGYGYIVSNNPLTNDEPQFYNYSAQIGNLYNTNTKVYAQEIDQFGLKRTILL